MKGDLDKYIKRRKRTGKKFTANFGSGYQEFKVQTEEELAEIEAYDSRRNQAHSEVAAGQFSTLAAYRAGCGRKVK